MSANRLRCLTTIERRAGLPVELISEKDLGDWEVASTPIHSSFDYLTAIQKSDYLRCYLLHHFGGGYTDVKETTESWLPALETLNLSRASFGVGYQEIGRHGVARLGLELSNRLELKLLDNRWWKYRWLQLNYRHLLGNGAFIFRPGSQFTNEWFTSVGAKMDKYGEQLRNDPGRHPRERPGTLYDFGISTYPIPWGDLQANVFHPLCYKYHRFLLQTLPPPLFTDYL